MEWPVTISCGTTTHCSHAWNTGWRHADFHKVYLIRQGSCQYDAGAGWQPLGSGMIHLIPGGRPHRHRCTEPMLLDWLHFRSVDAAISRRLSSLAGVVSGPVPELAFHLTAVDAALAGPESARLPLLTLILTLVARLDAAPDPQDPRLLAAARWIHDHAASRPDLAAMASRAGLHPVHFARRFVATFGCTPAAMAVARRMALAREALQDPAATVAEAAQRAGYADPFHFSRVFRRLHGRSPRAWRLRSAP